MHNWAHEYQDQLEGYEMSSKNKCSKKQEQISYTPQPNKKDQGGLAIFLLGLIFLGLMCSLGYLGYFEENKAQSIDMGMQQAIEGIKAFQEEVDAEQAQELDEYLKQYGLTNEDRGTDK